MPPTYRKQRPWHDGVIVAAMILGALLISRRLNLFPAIAQAYGIETVMALDDLMLVAMVLALALAVFAVRRWREAAAESVERRRTEFDLNERVKELTCLHAVTQVTDRHDLSLAEILGECVSLLPPAWLNPGIAEAHITFQGQSYATAGYVETPWMQSAEIAYFGQPAGRVAVCYRQAQPQADEGPFLREERALLDTVAERLGQVAERIHDAQELRSSESRYRTLFDSIGDAIFIHDQQGHILEVNSAACSRLGYTHDELVSLMLQDIDPDFGRLVPGLRASGATRDMLIFETTHLCRDGRAIPSEMSSRLTEYEGRPAVLTVARDISERKEGERAARELTRQLAIRNRIANVFLAAEDADLYNDVLQQVLEVMESPFGIFGYIDADHNLVCPSLTGAVWTKCQVEARTTVFPHKSWTGVWGQALAENRAIYRNKGFTVPAGHIPIERALAVPIRYQNEPIGLLLVANKGADYDDAGRDTLEAIAAYVSPILHARLRREETEHQRQAALEDLADSEAKYRLLIDAASDGIMVIDRAGTLLLANQRIAQVLGRPQHELSGCSLRELFPDQAESLLALLGQIFEGSDRRLFEHQLAVQGSVHWYGFNTQLLPDEDGRLPAIQIIARDITDQKRSERQLVRYASELEKRNDDIRNFAYIVSHDLRAPLVNLKGFSAELRATINEVKPVMMGFLPQLLESDRQRVEAAIEQDIPEALEFIERSVTRMDTFLSAVLQLSRFGRRELNFEPVDVHAVVQDVLSSLAHQIERQHITVTVGTLPQVVADRTSIEQVLNNLISNAVKYLEPGRPGRIEIYGEQNAEETIFYVRDNGRGIATEDFDKVLMPFRRAGRQDVPGEGVGLSYADTLVRRHAGRLEFDSVAGEGSTFSFSISHYLQGEDQHVHP